MQANIIKMQFNKFNNLSPQNHFNGFTRGQGNKFDVHNFLQNISNFARGKQGHVAHTCFQHPNYVCKFNKVLYGLKQAP